MTGPISHPLVLDGLVRERQADLRREVARARLRHEARQARRRPRRVRERTGWLLVEVGLRPRG